MRLDKRILKSEAVQGVLSRMAALYVRFVAATTRWTVEDAPLRRMIADGEVGIACFWHGRLMMMPYGWKERRGLGFKALPPVVHMMISHHRDGALISKTIRHLGVPTVAANNKKGGLAALREMKRKTDRGEWVAMTPDGPRGPRMRAKSGAIKLAQLSGKALLPASVGMSRGRILGSWDRFLLAWPFSRGYILVGEPVRVARNASEADLEVARKALEDSLNALTAEADRRCGRTPVQPEPLAEMVPIAPNAQTLAEAEAEAEAAEPKAVRKASNG